eukprot:84416-Lingulodinium_polyedra.AAC.1
MSRSWLLLHCTICIVQRALITVHGSLWNARCPMRTHKTKRCYAHNAHDSIINKHASTHGDICCLLAAPANLSLCKINVVCSNI